MPLWGPIRWQDATTPAAEVIPTHHHWFSAWAPLFAFHTEPEQQSGQSGLQSCTLSGCSTGHPSQFPRVQLCYPHSERLIRPTSTSHTNSYSEFPNQLHTPVRLQGIDITGSGPPNTHTMRQSSVHSNLMGRTTQSGGLEDYFELARQLGW